MTDLAKSAAAADRDRRRAWKVISSSAFDLANRVYDTLISSEVRLIGSQSSTICLRDGDVYRYRAHFGHKCKRSPNGPSAEHPATPKPRDGGGKGPAFQQS